VKNDPCSRGNHWYNGTIGYIREIKGNRITKKASSVSVEINDKTYKVFPEVDVICLPETPHPNLNIGTMTQFPFIPAFSMTIDKSQGLTLDKVYLVLDSPLRNNQLYVALSRARSLNDIILSRAITSEDVKVSSYAKCFYDDMKNCLTLVEHEKQANIIRNINIGCVFNLNIEKILSTDIQD
jgi:ATP-dependent exoDNAse (exonuclease V) alpha subunit